ncbi:MarR family transcriptional regulator [Rothia koreensis]|uniref:MarR family winged helix-turn-helix transcriptional regulator n=1 Tax=Rothia koreensis TaxID=592378 RepID=UPI003F23E65C
MKQESSANPLNQAIGYRLKQVEALLRVSMDEVLRSVGLTVSQYACLELIAQKSGLSNADLARDAFVSRQSMNLVLRGLQDRGLVQRPSTVERGRSRPTCLTTAGEDVVQRAGVAVAEVEERMAHGLDEGQRQMLLAGLSRCMENLAERPAYGA